MSKGLNVNETVDNTDTSTNQSNKHKAKNELVIRDSTDKRSYPRNGLGYPRANIAKHVSKGISGRTSTKSSFHKLFYIHKPPQHRDGYETKKETDKIADRFSHQEFRKLSDEPNTKILYTLQIIAPPALKIQ